MTKAAHNTALAGIYKLRVLASALATSSRPDADELDRAGVACAHPYAERSACPRPS